MRHFCYQQQYLFQAMKIETDAELERMKFAREADLHYTMEQNRMEVEKNKVTFNQFKFHFDNATFAEFSQQLFIGYIPLLGVLAPYKFSKIVNYQDMAAIETEKFKAMVEALGSETLQAIASGPQNQQVKYEC